MDEQRDRRSFRAHASHARKDACRRLGERPPVRDPARHGGEMKTLALTLLAAAAMLHAQDAFSRELDDAARVASVMIDGDTCRRIVTPRAMDFMLRTDPADRFLGSDNYEVDYAAFDSVKKTLIRIARLVSFPADANLWMPLPGHPDKVRVVIRNANEMSQFWPWGALYQDMVPEMKTVLDSGKRITVS